MMRRAERKPCPVPDCATEIPRSWLMCKPHWMSCAPKQRRDHQRIYRNWKSLLRSSDGDEFTHATNALRASCAARIAEATKPTRALA